MSGGTFGADRRIYIDWGKLWTLTLANGLAALLAITGTASPELASSVLLLTIGYTVGNGRQAVSGRPPAPMIGSVPIGDRRRAVETDNGDEVGG